MCSDISPWIRSGVVGYGLHCLLGKELDIEDGPAQLDWQRCGKVVVIFIEGLEGGDVELVDSAAVNVVYRIYRADIVGGFVAEERDSVDC
jgi:hypothetical protein